MDVKIAFLFKKDSHFKAVHATALRLCAQYDCQSVFIGIDTDYCPTNHKEIVYLQRDNLDCLVDYDYVVACLGGYLLNFVIRRLANTQTKVVSIFPGIVSHYQLDAFISRFNADQVWLNSRADLKLYRRLCKLFKNPNNGILYGMSWLNQDDYNKSNIVIWQNEEAIFFEQTEILSSVERKRRFLNTMESIVISNPKITFKYKIRDNSTDEYFKFVRNHLSQFENVKIVEQLSSVDKFQAKYYLSISSSALIEGIVLGKHSYIVDKELLDRDGKDFYRGSNIELRYSILADTSTWVNAKWYKQRIYLPVDNVDLLSVIKKSHLITAKNRGLSSIRLMFFKLAFFFPKIPHLFLNKPRLTAIQKSLEYLSTKSYE